MALKDDIENAVIDTLAQPWSLRDGTVVPTPDTVGLEGGGVKLMATFLYADLAESTKLAMSNKQVAAKVYKSFLAAATRLIRARGGEVRSFDGDRVMGVFVGDRKNTQAAKCALNINWAFERVVKPKLQAKYEIFRSGSYTLGQCTGVDLSDVLCVRSGIRNNNDLIWIGRAPNVAAKLSGLREPPHNSFISGEVYDKLADEAKFSVDGRHMWESRAWTTGPISRVYRSNWTWPPD